jgi:F420-dependent oxidoreductase-like protein
MVRFGTFVPQGWRLEMQHVRGAEEQWRRARGVALELERIGYDSLWLYDHFHTVPKTKIEPTFECWTMMAALADATSRVRLGQLVTCSLYRNPSYLAKVASCVDVMSGGRVDIGIGAGWKEDEFAAYGYPFPPIRERLDRMAETARILKAMCNEERASYAGRYYSVKDAVNEPKPVQRPNPPIWIGTQGEKVGLRMVAELADGWNHNRGADAFDAKRAALHGHCRRIGRDPSSVRISFEASCAIFHADAERRAYVERYWPGVDPAKIEAWLMNEGIAGTAEQVTDKLRFFVERGAELIILWFQDLADVGSGDTMAERFISEVAPRLRAVTAKKR